jgi:MoxR-like ATPase
MAETAFEIAKRLQANIERVVLGKSEIVQSLITALLAAEHVLLEDVPGVGKTLAAKALARSIEGQFNRLQFTPDLLPSDITGSSLFRADRQEFVFSEGPVFANVLLADEINRAPPRTQSALLEAMSEGQVSADGKTYKLPEPFIVVATQNPFEFEGTYPLPESQMDRFLLRTAIGYPQRDVEREVLTSHRSGEPVDHLSPVVTPSEVLEAQHFVRNVRFDESLADYLLEIVRKTRDTDMLRVGVSTRGALSFYRGCQARAVTEGRDFVTPDDIKRLAIPALSHRVIPEGIFQGTDREGVESRLAELLEMVAVPT